VKARPGPRVAAHLLFASSEFVAKDSRAPAKPEQRVVADAIVSSEAMRNVNAIVATGALCS
jgi:hypothetical protein